LKVAAGLGGEAATSFKRRFYWPALPDGFQRPNGCWIGIEDLAAEKTDKISKIRLTFERQSKYPRPQGRF
jgi:hypothetical protein